VPGRSGNAAPVSIRQCQFRPAAGLYTLARSAARPVRVPNVSRFQKETLVKQSIVIFVVLLLGVVISAQRVGPSPEMQAALAKQAELEKATPQLQITEEVLSLTVPNHTIGEAVGVAKNSRGHLFVFTRSGASGPAKGATASQLVEFDPNLKFVKQWGPDNYAASFAHTVRVDKEDNAARKRALQGRLLDLDRREDHDQRRGPYVGSTCKTADA
jgi:hypothetical protein